MKSNVYKTLPKREKLLLLTGMIMDNPSVRAVLSFDARHADSYEDAINAFESYPDELKSLLLLSYLSYAISE